MSAGKKSPPSPLVRRSRQARKLGSVEQQESLRLTASSRLRCQNKSRELCRRSDELLRHSRQLCNRLRKIRNAS